MKNIFALLFGLFFMNSFAQKDTLTFKNKDVIVGELKEMSNNVLIFKTSYSDKDFNIEFDKIISLNLEHRYTVSFSNGVRAYGFINTKKDHKVIITQEDGSTVEAKIDQIVSLRKIDEGFWHHFKGSFDFGYVLTQTNNSQQLTFAGTLNYYSQYWTQRAAYNQLFSRQDNVEDIRRIDASVEFKRYLKKKWFLYSNVSFLSNTSQDLEGRLTPSIGPGSYLVRNNKLFFLVGTGLTYNIERYTDPADNKTSTEAILLTQFSMFNYKNISLYAAASGNPSLSERGRFRANLSTNVKFDLPYDLYFKTELQANYDNQPFPSTIKTDYVFSTGVGWELK